MVQNLADRILNLQRALPPSVKLIAVTKQATLDQVKIAYDLGLRDFGENRFQVAQPKLEALADRSDVNWHFIGHLQTNKAKKVVAHFDWIHAVDSLKLAQKIDAIAEELNRQPKICLQVKLAPDPDKYGWQAEELWSDLPQLDQLTHVQIAGLMTILPLDLNEEQIAATFNQVAALKTKINQQPWQRINLTELSMGMTNDYGLAIAAGATMVRIGSAIFQGS
ncbi:MAG: YggS family pyridoxal phosphate-dependent enzyme [Synechococcaceae cyanobacterium RL_1_2]|nr:YggS family pyridoxal phosphate-dependent enzyme [Synechococcaceae cyanobacterium RL_1_2]